ncbi:MAG: ribosome recycling factor [Candidatus Peribacteraceae bacterium]|jgi:ribosome recycling factor
MATADIDQFKTEAGKAVEHLQSEYAKLQTGRAQASLVEHVEVEAYGGKQALHTVAGITIQDARTIVVQPWDKGVMQNVEQALQKADLGTSPVNDGTVLRINLPPMNEERRKQLVKHVHELAEEARISIRHHRQEAQENIRKEPDEDDRALQLKHLQQAVDEANQQIEDIAGRKEEELMTV